MAKESHQASRTIIATPRAIFRAFVDPEVITKWRAPAGMQASLTAFEPRTGGGYRMMLVHEDPAKATPKSSNDADIVEAQFIELLPEERIVELVRFQTDDPRFAGAMKITTTFTPVAGGTKVTIVAEDVPSGISEADHVSGMESSLKNLANLLE